MASDSTSDSTQAPVVVAFGGNALQRPGERGTVEEMRANLIPALRALEPIIASGCPLIISHGNGPQVGSALLRSDAAAAQVPAHSLDIAVATTQAEIGSVIATQLRHTLASLGIPREVVAVVTHVEVSADDPALLNPTKPIGPFYDQATAQSLERGRGWQMVEDSGRGWRRVVGSPRPIAVVEEASIDTLLAAGHIVIACGGGGVPVSRNGAEIHGVEAVIDKDRSAALLASRVGAGRLVILTGVDAVFSGFGTPEACAIDTMDVAAAQALLDEATLPAGSMAPKVEACVEFVRATGNPALITSEQCLAAALHGNAGTTICTAG